MQCVRFVGWHHVSAVYKLAVCVSVYVCNLEREREREGESSRVESLSHVAFLPVFRLLSGSSVVPTKIKQTPKNALYSLPPPPAQKHTERDGEKERTVEREIKLRIEIKMEMI